MGIIRVLIVFIVIALISGLVRGLLAKWNPINRLPGKKNNDFISEELYKLSELRRRGILTEEEFQREKKKLLNR